jgi:hypothetical protein
VGAERNATMPYAAKSLGGYCSGPVKTLDARTESIDGRKTVDVAPDSRDVTSSGRGGADGRNVTRGGGGAALYQYNSTPTATQTPNTAVPASNHLFQLCQSRVPVVISSYPAFNERPVDAEEDQQHESHEHQRVLEVRRDFLKATLVGVHPLVL